jgi:hypothetical protein
MVFLVALFLIKNGLIFKNTAILGINKQANGLTYGDATVADLVNKDTDGDGVLDWEEPLWDLDPTKKETVAGIPDSTTVSKLKGEQGISSYTDAENSENLTETDKFSRELFSSVAALTQSGTLDQAAIDKISDSLSDNIKNSTPRKIYLLSDLKITKDESLKSVQNYRNALMDLQNKYPDKGNVFDILKKFTADENNLDPAVLVELDPIIDQTQKTINALVKISVPQSIASFDLDFLNAHERILENEQDIKLFETDPVVTMGALSQFEKNVSLLQSTLDAVVGEIRNKLSS